MYSGCWGVTIRHPDVQYGLQYGPREGDFGSERVNIHDASSSVNHHASCDNHPWSSFAPAAQALASPPGGEAGAYASPTVQRYVGHVAAVRLVS